MRSRLLLRAAAFYLCGLLFVMLLLFLPAGTLHYPGGWHLIALLFGPMLLLGIVLFVKAPDLLEKRLRNKETQSTQKQVISFSALMFLAGFLLCGVDFRLSLTHVPAPVTTAACAVLLISYALYAEVMRENAYLSRTIEVQQDQKVIDTGLYGVVRHPMYAVTLFLFLSMPLVLGSLAGFIVFLIYPLLIKKRMDGEEALLKKELPGYDAYMRKVRYRLIPFIW